MVFQNRQIRSNFESTSTMVIHAEKPYLEIQVHKEIKLTRYISSWDYFGVCGVDLSLLLLLTGGRKVSRRWPFSFIRGVGRDSGHAQVLHRLKQRVLRVVGENGNTMSQ